MQLQGHTVCGGATQHWQAVAGRNAAQSRAGTHAMLHTSMLLATNQCEPSNTVVLCGKHYQSIQQIADISTDSDVAWQRCFTSA